MRRQPLNDACIRSLKPSQGQYVIWDTLVVGLGIRVSRGNTRSFTFQYRFGRKPRRLTFGPYPDVSLADARKYAREAKKELAQGNDPQRKKRDQKIQYAARLYPNLCNQYIEHIKKENRGWKELERILNRRELAERWRHVTVDTITKSEVAEALDAVLVHGPSAARHAFADLRRFFNWCKRREHILANPCEGLELKSRAKARKRVLTDYELIQVWQAAKEMGQPFGHLVQLLILTLQRRSEVAAIRIGDLDLPNRVWTQRVNKSDREHRVFLSDDATAVLQELASDTDGMLFPARGSDKPISGFSKWKRQLDVRSGVRDWCLHDLRRTATTRMSMLGVPIHVCELLLNHRTTALDGIAGVYNRNVFEEEQRLAMRQWAMFLRELVSRESSTAINTVGDHASDH